MKLAEKENEQYSDVITSLRTKLSFCILRAALLCVRGSRTPWRKNYHMKQEETDFALLNKEADIFSFNFIYLFVFLALRHKIFIRLFIDTFFPVTAAYLRINKKCILNFYPQGLK